MHDVANMYEIKYPHSLNRANYDSENKNIISRELIENNRSIKIIPNDGGDVYVIYTDLSAQAKIDSTEAVKNKQEYNKTLKVL